jgi:hypothetical protein
MGNQNHVVSGGAQSRIGGGGYTQPWLPNDREARGGHHLRHSATGATISLIYDYELRGCGGTGFDGAHGRPQEIRPTHSRDYHSDIG